MSLVNSYIYEGDEYVPTATGNDYTFTSWTFTNLGGTGRSGPLNTSKYSGAPWPDSPLYFSIANGVQSWRIPDTGSYKITVAGASNKYSVTDTRTGIATITQTRGSVVSFLVNLTRGDTLSLVVGQPGTSTSVSGTGGAGGTFVLTQTGNPVLIAGGAGGLAGSSGNDPSNCSASSSLVNFDAPQVWSGWAGSYNGTGGTAGSGGTGGNSYSGGGAGLLSDGTVSGIGGGSRWVGGFIPNGTGTQTNQDQGNGGFGGGGASAYLSTGGAGGGGGYSGGAGGNASTHGSGGSNYYMSPSSSAIFEGYNDVDTSVYPGTSSRTFGFGYINISLNTPSYTFTNWTFNNMNTSGPVGPVTGSTYSGSGFVGFSVTNGIQSWTVPKFGTYYILAAGASGGPSDTASGGRGAIVATSIVLQAGTVLKILVGQQGTKGTNNGGGGGGTFVAFSSNNSPILVAGGGGGAQSYNNGTFITGGDAILVPGSGQGASLSFYSTDAGSPGAGYYSDNSFTGSFVGGTARAFVNGGTTVTNGGFGCGGTFTTTNSGGGGGGYSGGQAGTDGIFTQPQGGTCFDWSSDVPISQGWNFGHGFVKIVSTDSTFYGLYDSNYFRTQLLIHSDPTVDTSSYRRTLSSTNVFSTSTQYKIGSSSMVFDGSTSVLTASNVSTMNTIEFWCYFNVTPTSNTVFVSGDSAWTMSPSSGLSQIGLSIGSNWRAGQWYNVVYTRDGNVHRSYRDGTLVSSVTNSNVFVFSNLIIGSNLNGYISEFRVSDIPRYTSNSLALQTLPMYPTIQSIILKLPDTPAIRYTADSVGQADSTAILTWNGLTATGSPTYRNIGGFSYIQFSGASDSFPTQSLPVQQVLNFGTNSGATFIYLMSISAYVGFNSILSFGSGSAENGVSAEYNFPLNSWFLFIINISGTTVSVYSNNALVATASLTSSLVNLLSSSLGFDLGAQQPLKHHGIAVYDRSLTVPEMTDVYNSVSSIIGTNL